MVGNYCIQSMSVWRKVGSYVDSIRCFILTQVRMETEVKIFLYSHNGFCGMFYYPELRFWITS